MTDNDHRDQLVDMLLRELVGEEVPPDVTDEVLGRLESGADRPRVRSSSSRPMPVSVPSSRNRWLALAAVITLAAAVAGLLTFRHNMVTAQSAILAMTKGGSVSLSEQLKPGTIITTGLDERAVLRWVDGTRITLEPSSRLELVDHSPWEPDKRLRLERGQVDANVARQPAGYPLRIATVHAEAVVIGTRFTLAQTDELTRLEVRSGLVRYADEGSGRAVEVAAGAFAESGPELPLRSGVLPVAISEPPVDPQPPALAVTSFTLMNADTDRPISGFDPLPAEAVIALSDLPIRRINIRANYTGVPEDVVFTSERRDGELTDLEPRLRQGFPPFFVAGDHSKAGRPADCRPWIPKPGRYRITATPHQGSQENRVAGRPLSLKLTILP